MLASIERIAFQESVPSRLSEGLAATPRDLPIIYHLSALPVQESISITARLDLTQLPVGQVALFTIDARESNGIFVFARGANFDLRADTPAQTAYANATVMVPNAVSRVPVSISWTTDFGQGNVEILASSHVIYLIPGNPTLPWFSDQTYPDSINCPWADALDVACGWAHGARNLDDALKLIVNGLYDDARIASQDSGGGPTFLYDTGFATNYTDFTFYEIVTNVLTFDQFHLTDFLQRLSTRKGVRGAGVNCQDCASAVATFGNLMGADLVELTIGPGPAHNFPVRDVVPIGESVPRSTLFANHAVAAQVGATVRDTIVYDACVGFAPDFRPIVGMPLDEYLLRLTDPGAAVADLAAGTRRRIVGTPTFKQNF